MKTILNTLVLIGAGILTSCTTQHNGIKPVSPGVYMPYQKPVWAMPFTGGLAGMLVPDKPIKPVDNLQPTLKWEPVPGAESYDMIVYTGVPKDDPQVTWVGKEKIEKKRTGWFLPGKEVYYREAIRETSHRVETPLLPESAYVWSVRTRTGTNASRWSTYNFRKGNKVVWIMFDGVAGNNWWWPFQTPKQ